MQNRCSLLAVKEICCVSFRPSVKRRRHFEAMLGQHRINEPQQLAEQRQKRIDSEYLVMAIRLCLGNGSNN